MVVWWCSMIWMAFKGFQTFKPWSSDLWIKIFCSRTSCFFFKRHVVKLDWGDDPKMAPPIISSILSTLQTKPWWNVLGLFGPFITLGPKDWGYEISWVDFIRMVPIFWSMIDTYWSFKHAENHDENRMKICSCRRSKTCWHKRMLGVFTGCGRVNLGNLGQVNSSLYLGNIYI